MRYQTRLLVFDTQLKFDYFLLGLTFALLGMSIQTANFSSSFIINIVELAGWCSLLLTGFLGFLQMREMTKWAGNYDNLNIINDKLQELQKERDKCGETVLDQKSNKYLILVKDISSKEEESKELSDDQNKIQKGIQKIARIKYSFFTLGVICLLFSRAYKPIQAFIFKF
jgi:hypothetical protein